jgi:hypothetical protein
MGRDFNDMNELVLYGLKNFSLGLHPYAQDYILTIQNFEYTVHSYPMWFSYGPGVFIIYLPVLLYPELLFGIDLNPIMLIENFIFDYLTSLLLYKSNHQLGKYAGIFYWWCPFFAIMAYLCFYSPLFFFLVAAYQNKEFPLKSGFFSMFAVICYHLFIFYPVIFVVYIFFPASTDQKSQDPNTGYFQFTRIKSIFQNLPVYLRKIWYFVLGALLPAIWLVFFFIWDFQSTMDGLFHASAGRFNTGWIQILFIFGMIFATFLLIFIPNSNTAEILSHILIMVTYIIETFILNLHGGYFYSHYIILMLPAGIMLFFMISDRILTQKT